MQIPAHIDTPVIIFFDVDGTLIWHDPASNAAENVAHARPTPGVVEAFARMRERGHLPIICTGRPLCLLQRELLDLQPAGLVLSAGAALQIDGTMVRERVIEVPLLEQTVRLFAELGVEVIFEGSQTVAAFLPNGGDYTDIPGTIVCHTLDELREKTPMRFSKFSYTNEMLPRLARMGDFIAAHFGQYDLGLGTGECTLLGVDKGAGVRDALEALGFDGARTFAFGDSENDLPMLQAVETPVAMGNALASVKAAATYVTDSAEHDGVVTGLEHFGLI